MLDLKGGNFGSVMIRKPVGSRLMHKPTGWGLLQRRNVDVELAALSGQVSQVNLSGYDPVSAGGSRLSWVGRDKASRTWANVAGQWVGSWA
jgi:hypothetical protein